MMNLPPVFKYSFGRLEVKSSDPKSLFEISVLTEVQDSKSDVLLVTSLFHPNWDKELLERVYDLHVSVPLKPMLRSEHGIGFISNLV